MLASLLIPIVVLTSSPADTIRVGDPTLLTTLSPGIETVDNFVFRNGEKRLVITYVLSISEVSEGYRIVQENRLSNGNIASLDTIVVTEGTLATVWHGDVTRLGRKHVAFSDGRMTGVAFDTLNQEKQINVDVPRGLFDYSIMTLVADHLPLSVGYKAVIATYDITRGEVFVPIEVVDKESVELEDGTYDTWKMEVDVGGQKVTRWVERDTRREIKWSVDLNGRQMVGERRKE